MSFVPVDEQGTVIQHSRTEHKFTVYTSDQRKITKLDKFCKEDNPEWKEISVDKINDEIVSKTYETSEKNILYLRKHINPSISPERKEEARLRMIEINRKKKLRKVNKQCRQRDFCRYFYAVKMHPCRKMFILSYFFTLST